MKIVLGVILAVMFFGSMLLALNTYIEDQVIASYVWEYASIIWISVYGKLRDRIGGLSNSWTLYRP